MSDVTISVDDREVRAMLSRAPAQINRALRASLTDAGTYILRQLQTYPAQRSGSTYKRTGNLGRSWSMRGPTGTGEGMQIVVGSNANTAPYNRRVQDRLQQAAPHRGRWSTVQDIAERSRATVQRFLDDRLRAELR